MRSATKFEILVGSTITNTGLIVVSGGDLGLSPGTAVTGFPPGNLTPPAVMHLADPVAEQTQADLTTAYSYAAGLSGVAALPLEMSGLTFTPGPYKTSTTTALSAGQVTLDAQVDANAVFIFQVGSTLTTIRSTQVVLTGSAQAKNVFWQVGSDSRAGLSFPENDSDLSINHDTDRRKYNRPSVGNNAAVTLDTNAITAPEDRRRC